MACLVRKGKVQVQVRVKCSRKGHAAWTRRVACLVRKGKVQVQVRVKCSRKGSRGVDPPRGVVMSSS